MPAPEAVYLLVADLPSAAYRRQRLTGIEAKWIEGEVAEAWNV